MVALGQDEEEEEEQEERGPGRLAERLLKSRTVLLTEQIDKDLAEDVVTKLLLLDQEGDEPIKLYLNSPGGDVDAGFAIYDMAQFIDSPVICISAGLTASAAVVALLAAPAERRLSLPNSRFLLHQPSTGVRGSTADIEIEADEILKMRDRINELIAEQTGQDLEKVEKDTQRNFWMDADQALDYGLISRIVESKRDVEEGS